MSAKLDKGFQAVFGSSPKEIYDIEARIKGCQEKLDYAYGARISSRFWSDGDLENFKGAKWTPAEQKQLLSLSDVWIRSLVDKESFFRLPELTAYLALHYPQVKYYTKPALNLLDATYQVGSTERSVFSDCHLPGTVPSFGKKTTDPNYVRFRFWYESLTEYNRVALTCYLALGFIQLCNKTVEEVHTYLTNHALHDFQKYWGIPANNMMWVPKESLKYLKSYFQPSSQLLVTVLRPFLSLREHLLKTNTQQSLLDSLNSVFFMPTRGIGLELVQSFQEVVRIFDLTYEQLLADMPVDATSSTKRLEEFTSKYGLAVSGNCYWARHFSGEYFAEYQVQHNKKAIDVLTCLIGNLNIDELEDADKNWVNMMMSKYSTREERASTACFEGFWDGARRLDYA